ncbi:DUF3089 domain-containing protein [Sphingomonas cannabina]|uniref:DUF3089 domain-containing protein n=1 Tax=Sphingomonas cannabina TaxID=2899123 RepID=UPI001F3755F1|nr:DUF3089 domain-containing protein [Sphingomonas cannabina]UIJ46456.1 DUF3089 domain-containing protein [Sphingomonas cannabina]
MRSFAIRLALAAAALAVTGPASGQLLQALKIMRNNRPPAAPFAQLKPPPPPDYARPSEWAALPTTRDEADATPPGIRAIDQTQAEVDVFFIYPTVLMSRDVWNADTRDPELNRRIETTTIRSQATVFNGCCAIYAPRYRQMTLGGYMKWSDNSVKATELAYSDVARAFRVFLDRYNRGRPFILAGHSQGSRLARLLIEREIDGRPVANRLVAAYLLGHWIEADWFSHLRSVRACTRAFDTGCVVTWSTFAEGRDGSAQRRTLGIQSKYKPEQLKRPYVGINPLTWTTDGTVAPKSLNKGSWLPGPGPALRSLDVGLVSARYRDGAVYVSPPGIKSYTDYVIPFGNYHNLDYAMFWMNLRENAQTRVNAFWKH